MKNSTPESVLLNAFKQQHLINSTTKKHQEALAAVFLDANNNRISSVNNVSNQSSTTSSLSNTAAAALNLTPIDQSVKNSNPSNNQQTIKCKSPSTAADLNTTLASVVNNLFALNNQQQHQESDSNNNSISCKNQNDLLGASNKPKTGEPLDNNNTDTLTSASLLAAAANLSDLNSALFQQDCNNNNKMSSSSLSNQSGLGTIGKAFKMMAKMASTGGSTLDSACKNLLMPVDVEAGNSNMESEDQNAIQTEIDLNFSQILDDEQFHFRLTPPNSTSTNFPNLQYICEYSSRLLFLSVQWAQSITVFKKFTDQTQVQLLRSCWCDLFILGKKFALSFDVKTILTIIYF